AGIVIGIIAIFFIGWIVYSSGNGSDASSNFLSSSGTARGLITFSVAIVTVAIALILVLYVITGSAGDDFKERFTFGKDILMVFVGILGTIMGYYYAEDKISPGDISKITAASIQENTSPIVELENKAFAALLSKDFPGALKAFGDAYAAFPGWHNLEAINKLLNNRKDILKPATDAVNKPPGDTAEKEKAWQSIFCDISRNNLTLGMSKQMIAQVQGFCSGTETREEPPANSNTGVNTIQTPVK
ncbi:MAG TPA: hypothetical protein VJV05_01930, partial [Pyrinomonadaceae bacterium]|nr:hypothetical protein [Pyrinomonadaceae bacterium]